MLQIADKQFDSRLIIGTGKFSTNAVMVKAIEASGSQIVTVALRRVDPHNRADDISGTIDKKHYLFLPNHNPKVFLHDLYRKICFLFELVLENSQIFLLLKFLLERIDFSYLY